MILYKSMKKYLLFIDDIVSVIGRADGTESGVKLYGDMVTWNVISLVGYGVVEYI